ncbi:MAG TPA: DUF692 domain-containing protein [Blastocatellia bacterium]|nr:DUF692 domain-containing protein [Blastocatellia bacterium]
MNPQTQLSKIGIGWRPELALMIERDPQIDFIEVVAENISPDDIPRPLLNLKERGATIIPHGTGLSLGSAEPLDLKRLAHLARLAERLGSPFVSEHVAFVRAAGRDSGHLLPLPRTRAALDVLAENILEAQAALPVPLALENIATLFEWPGAEMSEAAFITAALERTNARLLLDVANLYANARNHGWDAAAYLDGLPLGRLAYVHIAGGVAHHRLYHDTHAHPTPRGALALLEQLSARAHLPVVLLERDDHFPVEAELRAELDAIAAAIERGAQRRSSPRAALLPQTMNGHV